MFIPFPVMRLPLPPVVSRSAADPVAILMDDREQRSELAAVLCRRADVVLRVERLPVGDYRVGDAILIERKTVPDFVRSLISGRLFSQAQRLVREPCRAAFLIEGPEEAWSRQGLSREASLGAWASLALVFDLPVLRTVDADESARLLVYAGRQERRAHTGGDAAWGFAKAKRKVTRQRRLLQMLPGVGPERAKRLLEHFGTVRACLDADAEGLQAIEGIGAQTAETIVETVNEDAPVYSAGGWHFRSGVIR